MSFVVAGVSGNTGKIVAESLLAQKREVRVVVRDEAKGQPWKAKGAEVAVADLSDPAALGRALRGAEGAYLLIPPTFAAPKFRAYQDGVTDAIVAAVEASHVPHVVLLSSLGAQHPAGTGPIAGLHRAEDKLGKIAGTSSTFLRAGYFMENLGSSLATLGQGFIPSFLPADFGIPMVATVDIGRLAASLLLEGALEGAKASQIVELAGPLVTSNDVAASLTKITGAPVRVQEAPMDAVVPTFTSFGMPKDLANLYREMFEAMVRGQVTFAAGNRRVLGATPVETVLRGLLTKS